MHAESAGINLRAAENFWQIVLEFRNFLTEGAKIQDAQFALESEIDDSVWAELLAEVEGFNPRQPDFEPVFLREPLAAATLILENQMIRFDSALRPATLIFHL